MNKETEECHSVRRPMNVIVSYKFDSGHKSSNEETGQGHSVSKETDECHSVSKKTDECHSVSKETEECHSV